MSMTRIDGVQRTLQQAIEDHAGGRMVLGVNAEVVTRARTEKVAGGKRYIPLSALEAVGAVFLEGVPKYGEWNWKQGAGDKAYQMERWEHASRHLQLWAEGDRTENHLAKVMWFCATQIELERMERREEEEKNTVEQRRTCETPDTEEVREEIRQLSGEERRELQALIDQLKAEIRGMGLDRPVAGRNAAHTVPVPDGVAEVKARVKGKGKAGKKPTRVISEEGKERIAAAQRRRWARVRRMKKAEGKGK